MKEWPKLKRDYAGLRVRIIKPIQNGRGEAAEVGRTATVYKSYGGLELKVDVCDKCGTKFLVKNVPESFVELI